MIPLKELTYLLICQNFIFSKSRPVSPPLHLSWPVPIIWSFTHVQPKMLTSVLRLPHGLYCYLNRSCYHLRMPTGIWFGITPCRKKSGHFTQIKLGRWCPLIHLWMLLVVGGCTRLNDRLIVRLTNIKHGWLPTTSLSKRGLIIWRGLVRWLTYNGSPCAYYCCLIWLEHSPVGCS